MRSPSSARRASPYQSSSPDCPARAQRRIFTPARVMSGRHPRKEADSRASDLGTAVSRTGAVDPAAEGRNTMVSAERLRLDEADTGGVPWQRWGPYLSERQWGTVREDYGSGDNTWSYFPHEQARSRAYRWGEDGLAGVSDDRQQLCLALGLWNGRDPILKERLFGLTNAEGNHGEDVKECYFYLDATPTSSYLKMLYKYPQAEFPYADLVAENRRRGSGAPEYELLDTGIFDEDRYFDVFVEYAQAGIDDVLMRVTAYNRGNAPAPLHLLPQLVFRDTWSWKNGAHKPQLRADGNGIVAEHETLGTYHCCAGSPSGPNLHWLTTENATNSRRLYSAAAEGPFKDGFHEYLIAGRKEAVSANGEGTKAAAHFRVDVPAHLSVSVNLRLSRVARSAPLEDFKRILDQRIAEADEFYAEL